MGAGSGERPELPPCGHRPAPVAMVANSVDLGSLYWFGDTGRVGDQPVSGTQGCVKALCHINRATEKAYGQVIAVVEQLIAGGRLGESGAVLSIGGQ